MAVLVPDHPCILRVIYSAEAKYDLVLTRGIVGHISGSTTRVDLDRPKTPRWESERKQLKLTLGDVVIGVYGFEVFIASNKVEVRVRVSPTGRRVGTTSCRTANDFEQPTL
jgi:hypothetical protein